MDISLLRDVCSGTGIPPVHSHAIVYVAALVRYTYQSTTDR
jgi:hypothetical protein